jgi:hypothetical protein
MRALLSRLLSRCLPCLPALRKGPPSDLPHHVAQPGGHIDLQRLYRRPDLLMDRGVHREKEVLDRARVCIIDRPCGLTTEPPNASPGAARPPASGGMRWPDHRALPRSSYLEPHPCGRCGGAVDLMVSPQVPPLRRAPGAVVSNDPEGYCGGSGAEKRFSAESGHERGVLVPDEDQSLLPTANPSVLAGVSSCPEQRAKNCPVVGLTSRCSARSPAADLWAVGSPSH